MTLTPSQRPWEPLDVVIENGASLSVAYNLRGKIPVGIYISAAWTAADLTFRVSPDGVKYYNLHTSAGEYSLTTSAGIFLSLSQENFAGTNFIKVRSGTGAVPVNQAAARALVLMCAFPDPA